MDDTRRSKNYPVLDSFSLGELKLIVLDRASCQCWSFYSVHQQLEVSSILASVFVFSQLSFLLYRGGMRELLVQVQHPEAAIAVDFQISALDHSRETETAEIATITQFAEKKKKKQEGNFDEVLHVVNIKCICI